MVSVLREADNMGMTDTELLAEVERVLAKATPGPWDAALEGK
jgi:hypothetical protein